MITNALYSRDFRGLSTDDKNIIATSNNGVIQNGSTFFEIDTGKLYMYDVDSNTWIEV